MDMNKTETMMKTAPYAAWMALLMTGQPYWLRTVCAGILLVPWAARNLKAFKFDWPGVLAGLAVFAVWIAPETLGLVQTGGKAAAAHPFIQLFGSAVVIATAEELFFRDWLYNWLTKSWSRHWAAVIMILLFAVEHDKYFCAIIAGTVYFALYLRRGLSSAIIAHVTTNFALGAYVILTKSWYLW